MEKNEWKNDIHVIEIRIMLKSGKLHQISNILLTKHDNEHVAELVLNSIKSKRSLKIMRFVKMS
jgi:hypothetical protein